MYSLSQLRRGLGRSVTNPKFAFRELNRLIHTRRCGPDYNRDGIDVIEEDWDTLIIVDACRFDLFEEENTLPGQLETRISRGSHTSEFLRGNFHQRELLDTVYTTATPQLSRRKDELDVTFYNVNNVWNTHRWDDNAGTVRPRDMTDAAIEAIRTHPNKRHIIHYLQPHYPFIQSTVDDDARGIESDSDTKVDIWRLLFRDKIDISGEEVFEAYRENFVIALDEIHRLLEEVSGKTVVTSDHGNMFGERATPIPIKEWGHPPRLYTPELVTVPWLVYKSGERRVVRAGNPQEDEERDVNEDKITDRLEDLGYVT